MITAAERGAHKSATGQAVRARMYGPASDVHAPTEVAVRPRSAVAATGRLPGDQVLDYLRTYMGRFVHWPSAEALDAVVLWTAHAAARDAQGVLIWRATPRLLLTSTENGSGKSTVLDMITLLLGSRFGRLSKVTPRALGQILGRYHEVAAIDEVQSTFGAGRAAESLRQAINAGYSRRANALAMNGSRADAVSVFGPVCMAGLDSLITDTNGRLQDTLARSLIVRLYRAPRRMPELDEVAEEVGERLAAGLAAWCAQAGREMAMTARQMAADAAAEPDEADPADIGDGGRYAQISRPLRAVARVAGGRWPEAAEAAIAELARAAQGADQADTALDDIGAIMSAWGTEGSWQA